MNTNILATAATLSDRDLLARIDVLARRERQASAELVAHLAVLDTRPALYAAEGFGSLFSYCTQALGRSEDAACTRIEAARAARRFPEILDLLTSGSLTLTAVRLLGRHLTPENHEAVRARASGGSRRAIEALVAELAPRPDMPSSVRRLPTRPGLSAPKPEQQASDGPSEPVAPPPPALHPPPRPIVQATAPERYRVQFTIGPEAHDTLRRLQALLRREIPDGDPAAIVERALALLLEKVEKTKLGAATRPRTPRSIRPGTDEDIGEAGPASRHVPRAVRRAVYGRDGGQCGFVSPTGRRCTERTFVEFHHVRPHAQGGSATVANISLRCRRHNQHEAELVFGPRRASSAREGGEGLGPGPPTR